MIAAPFICHAALIGQVREGGCHMGARSLWLVPLLLLAMPAAADAPKLEGCSFKGFKLHGRVQVVESFPDIKVMIVNSFADLHVQVVESFPDACGKWQMVATFPDLKVQFVNSFPDVTISYVTSFPGVRG
jgi:hypothetical protein